jgi:peptidyl-prolyl cis-trans isomerase SurA
VIKAPTSIDWQQVAAVVWAIGFGVVLIGGVALYLREMSRFKRSAVPVSESLTTLTQRMAHALKLSRAPAVLMSPCVSSPAVAGLWRPVVLLPVDFEDAFTHAEAELVLRHELMHLKRWDLPFNALFCLLQALHWFNPVLWFASARLRQDRESACDSQVLASSVQDCRTDYGLALLKVQTTCQPPSFGLGLVGMFGDHAAVKSRIAAIARYRRAHPLKGLLAAVIIVALGALGATHPEAPNFELGKASFAKGDSIRITSVDRSDALITVSGDYELASQDDAVLALYITAKDKEHARTTPDPQQRMSVKKGTGSFTLVHPHPHAGMPHVSFYPSKGGQVFGGIYFGTKEEAEASKLMSHGTTKPTKTAAGTDKTAGRSHSPVASVDGRLILASELEDAVAAQRQVIQYKHRDNPADAAAEFAKLGSTALDQLIDRQLILAEFKKIGGVIKPESVERDTDTIIKSQFKGDRDAFIAEMAKKGISMKKFYEMRETTMIVQVMRGKFGGKQEQPTADDVKHYYDDHQAKWRTGDKLKVSTITIPKHVSDKGSTVEKQKQLAADLHAQLVSGAEFAALARTHSQDSRAIHAGAWDEMETSKLNGSIREAARATQPGALALLIDDASAFMILRVDSKKEGTVAPLETVKADIEKTIKAERSAAEMEKWLVGLRAKASIKRFE